MKCYPPHVQQSSNRVNETRTVSSLHYFQTLGEVPRQIEGWRCQEELHPKTPEPLLVSPTKATTGVRWASLSGSIAPAASCEWRAWSTNSLAPSCSCVSQSLNVYSFCICASVWMAVGLHAQTQSPPLLSDWSLFDGTWIAGNLPVRYKRPGCRSGTSTFSSVRKLRLWYPYA